MVQVNPFDIAIVGWAGRFPGAATVEQLWHNLLAGRESLVTLTADELAAEGTETAAVERGAYVPRAACIADADMFDAEYFGVTPRDAEMTDPQHRVFLEEAVTALEDAGYGARNTRSIGVYAGAGPSSYSFLLRANAGDAETAIALGNEPDYLATRVSFRLDLSGPSVTVLTACSTSLVAVHLGCQALRDYECDMALAGGVSISPPLRSGYWRTRPGVQSSDGSTRTFDAAGDGTVFGHGAGVVVLKRLAEAVTDGDTVRAVIRGSAINNDGSAKSGFSAPSVDGQRDAIAAALEMAQVDAGTVGYVETHGTGTAVGDTIEIAALTEAFRRSGTASGYCAVGSLKPNIGHLDAAAGVAGLIKAALCVRHGIIPATLNFQRPNPDIAFEDSPFFVADRKQMWPSLDGPRRACVSSFGFGGTNAHAVLEQPPTLSVAESVDRPELLLLSARTDEALARLRERFADRLADCDARWADIAYTTRVGRRPAARRCAIVAASAAEAVELLSGRAATVARGTAPCAVALAVSDAMPRAGLDIELEHADARLAAVLQEVRSAFRELSAVGASDAEPSFAVSYALGRLLLAHGIVPVACVGTGIGAHVADVLAGRATLREGIRALLAGDRPHRQPALPSARDGETIVVDCGARGDGGGTAHRAVALVARDGESGARAVLRALGELWAAGVPVNWEEDRADGLRRVPLPTYPFERRRFWPRPPAALAVASRAHTPPARARDLDGWLRVPVWMRDPFVPTAEAEPGATIVIGADDLLTAAVAERVDAAVVFRLEQRQGPQGMLRALRAELDAQVSTAAARVIYLGGTTAEAEASWRTALDFTAPLEIVRTLAARPVRLDLVSAGVFSVTGSEPLQPERALIVGPARVTAAEYRWIDCRHYDLDLGELSHATPTTRAASAIALGCGRRDGAPSIAVRGGAAWVQTLAPSVPPAREPLDARADGATASIHVVTGGLGGVGLALAARMAEREQATLVLVSRDAEATARRSDAAGALACLEATGATVEIGSCDVADEAAFGCLLADVVARHGAIASIVHAAGVRGGGLIRSLAPEAADATFRAKVTGSRVIIDAAVRFGVAQVVLCSSLSTFDGRIGTVDYTAANAVLDARAATFAGQQAPRVIAIAWGAWEGIGMAADVIGNERSADDREVAFSGAAGAEAFDLALQAHVSQVVVSPCWPLSGALDSAPEAAPATRPDATAIRTRAVRKLVTEAWTRLLGIDAVDAGDDFFEVGGDSLLALELLDLIETAGGGKVALSDFLAAPTVDGLLAVLPAVATGETQNRQTERTG